jgi:hypothetical protein
MSKQNLGLGIFVFFLIGILVFAFPVQSVFAASLAQTTATPAPGAVQQQPNLARLEKLYQAELKQLDRQTKMLTTVNNGITRFENFITNQKENGKDPQKLVDLLAKFRTELSKAQAAHDKAAGVLTAHAGFDASGKITDAQLAKTTLKDGEVSLNQARRGLIKMAAQIKNVMKRVKK